MEMLKNSIMTYHCRKKIISIIDKAQGHIYYLEKQSYICMFKEPLKEWNGGAAKMARG